MGRAGGVVGFIMLIVGLALAPGLALATPLQLGAPYSVVRTAFADGHERSGVRRRVLEVAAPRFAGLTWRKADFAFDPTDHLASVTLSTTEASFADIEALMTLALAQADAAPPGEEGLAQDREGDVQIRICEADDGAVTVTFERTAV